MRPTQEPILYHVKLFCKSIHPSSFLDKVLHLLHLIHSPGLKALQVMEDEVGSRKCDLISNIMIVSLEVMLNRLAASNHNALTSLDGSSTSSPGHS